MQKYNNRQEVPEKYKWNLTDFFKDEEEFNTSFTECEKLIKELATYQGCTKDAKRIYEFITKEVEAISLWEDLYVYSYLVNDQELGNSESIARKSKTENLQAELTKAISFFAPELLQLEKEDFAKLFQDNKELELYRHDLEMTYRDKEHILPEDKENIVTSLINAMNHFDDIASNLRNQEHDYGVVKNAKGEEEVLSITNYRRLMKESSRDKREKIYKQLFGVLDNYGATHASLLDSYVKMNTSVAKIHNFKSAWDKKLFGLNMPSSAYDALVKTVEDNCSVFQKFFELKRKVLKLDTLEQYDLPLDMIVLDKTYTIEEMQDLVKEAIAPLGSKYGELFNKIIDNRYVDYCQYKGKCSGGYSFSTMNQDSRILMSFNGDLTSVSTFAHEGGHNVHHQCVAAANPKIYRDVTSLVSEVASLTNECLLSSHLAAKGHTKEEKLAGLENILEVIISNMFAATREGKMEQDMYEYVLSGGTLTKDYLDTLNTKSLEKYYGNSLNLNEYSKASWIIRSHYYMNFYLYSYAICISVASFVASHILNGDEKMLANYQKFLATGSDVWPIDAFKILGVDLTDKKVYEEAIRYFESLVTEFENIINS